MKTFFFVFLLGLTLSLALPNSFCSPGYACSLDDGAAYTFENLIGLDSPIYADKQEAIAGSSPIYRHFTLDANVERTSLPYNYAAFEMSNGDASDCDIFVNVRSQSHPSLENAEFALTANKPRQKEVLAFNTSSPVWENLASQSKPTFYVTMMAKTSTATCTIRAVSTLSRYGGLVCKAGPIYPYSRWSSPPSTCPVEKLLGTAIDEWKTIRRLSEAPTFHATIRCPQDTENPGIIAISAYEKYVFRVIRTRWGHYFPKLRNFESAVTADVTVKTTMLEGKPFVLGGFSLKALPTCENAFVNFFVEMEEPLIVGGAPAKSILCSEFMPYYLGEGWCYGHTGYTRFMEGARFSSFEDASGACAVLGEGGVPAVAPSRAVLLRMLYSSAFSNLFSMPAWSGLLVDNSTGDFLYNWHTQTEEMTLGEIQRLGASITFDDSLPHACHSISGSSFNIVPCESTLLPVMCMQQACGGGHFSHRMQCHFCGDAFITQSRIAWAPAAEDPAEARDRLCEKVCKDCEQVIDAVEGGCIVKQDWCVLVANDERVCAARNSRRFDQPNEDYNIHHQCLQCRPELSQSVWSFSAFGARCDDMNLCTRNDMCLDGFCQGTPFTCLSPDFYPEDEWRQCEDCNGRGCSIVPDRNRGQCRSKDRQGRPICGCVIDGKCYAHGASNPDDPCFVCDVVRDDKQWTQAPNDYPCDDGNSCTYDDVCQDSVCTGISYSCEQPICGEEMSSYPNGCDGTGQCMFAASSLGKQCAPGISECSPPMHCNGVMFTCPERLNLTGAIALGSVLFVGPVGQPFMPESDTVSVIGYGFQVQCESIRFKLGISPYGIGYCNAESVFLWSQWMNMEDSGSFNETIPTDSQLLPQQSYRVVMVAENVLGDQAVPVCSSRFLVDDTPPFADPLATVIDVNLEFTETETDVDQHYSSRIRATWKHFFDPESDWAGKMQCMRRAAASLTCFPDVVGVGSTNGYPDLIEYHDIGTFAVYTSDPETFVLEYGKRYHVFVKAYNRAGLESEPLVSDGFISLFPPRPPTPGGVFDGDGRAANAVDATSDFDFVNSPNSLRLHWEGFGSSRSTGVELEYAAILPVGGQESLPEGVELLRYGTVRDIKTTSAGTLLLVEVDELLHVLAVQDGVPSVPVAVAGTDKKVSFCGSRICVASVAEDGVIDVGVLSVNSGTIVQTARVEPWESCAEVPTVAVVVGLALDRVIVFSSPPTESCPDGKPFKGYMVDAASDVRMGPLPVIPKRMATRESEEEGILYAAFAGLSSATRFLGSTTNGGVDVMVGVGRFTPAQQEWRLLWALLLGTDRDDLEVGQLTADASGHVFLVMPSSISVLLKLNGTSGEELWRHTVTWPPVESQFVHLAVCSSAVYLAATVPMARAWSSSDDSEVWIRQINADSGRLINEELSMAPGNDAVLALAVDNTGVPLLAVESGGRLFDLPFAAADSKSMLLGWSADSIEVVWRYIAASSRYTAICTSSDLAFTVAKGFAGNQTLLAVNSSTAETVWSTGLAASGVAKMCFSPHSQRLVLAAEASLLFYSSATGALLDTVALGDAISAVECLENEDTVAVANGRLISNVRASDGEIRWEEHISEIGSLGCVVSTPARMLFGAFLGGECALDVGRSALGTGESVWKKTFAFEGCSSTVPLAMASTETTVYIAGISDGTFARKSPQGDVDVFLLALDTALGSVQWFRFYGSPKKDSLVTVLCDANSVYLFGSSSTAFNGFPSGMAGEAAYLARLDSVGAVLWVKHFGSDSADEIVFGASESPDSSAFFVAGSAGFGSTVNETVIETSVPLLLKIRRPDPVLDLKPVEDDTTPPYPVYAIQRGDVGGMDRLNAAAKSSVAGAVVSAGSLGADGVLLLQDLEGLLSSVEVVASMTAFTAVAVDDTTGVFTAGPKKNGPVALLKFFHDSKQQDGPVDLSYLTSAVSMDSREDLIAVAGDAVSTTDGELMDAFVHVVNSYLSPVQTWRHSAGTVTEAAVGVHFVSAFAVLLVSTSSLSSITVTKYRVGATDPVWGSSHSLDAAFKVSSSLLDNQCNLFVAAVSADRVLIRQLQCSDGSFIKDIELTPPGPLSPDGKVRLSYFSAAYLPAALHVAYITSAEHLDDEGETVLSWSVMTHRLSIGTGLTVWNSSLSLSASNETIGAMVSLAGSSVAVFGSTTGSVGTSIAAADGSTTDLLALVASNVGPELRLPFTPLPKQQISNVVLVPNADKLLTLDSNSTGWLFGALDASNVISVAPSGTVQAGAPVTELEKISAVAAMGGGYAVCGSAASVPALLAVSRLGDGDTPLWMGFHGSRWGQQSCVAMASVRSSLYVLGTVTMTVNGQPFLGGDSDIAVFALDADNGKTVSTLLLGTGGRDAAVALAADLFGVYVAGSRQDGPMTARTLVWALSTALDLLWDKSLGESEADLPTSLVSDGNSALYLCVLNAGSMKLWKLSSSSGSTIWTDTSVLPSWTSSNLMIFGREVFVGGSNGTAVVMQQWDAAVGTSVWNHSALIGEGDPLCHYSINDFAMSTTTLYAAGSQTCDGAETAALLAFEPWSLTVACGLLEDSFSDLSGLSSSSGEVEAITDPRGSVLSLDAGESGMFSLAGKFPTKVEFSVLPAIGSGIEVVPVAQDGVSLSLTLDSSLKWNGQGPPAVLGEWTSYALEFDWGSSLATLLAGTSEVLTAALIGNSTDGLDRLLLRGQGKFDDLKVFSGASGCPAKATECGPMIFTEDQRNSYSPERAIVYLTGEVYRRVIEFTHPGIPDVERLSDYDVYIKVKNPWYADHLEIENGYWVLRKADFGRLRLKKWIPNEAVKFRMQYDPSIPGWSYWVNDMLVVENFYHAHWASSPSGMQVRFALDSEYEPFHFFACASVVDCPPPEPKVYRYFDDDEGSDIVRTPPAKKPAGETCPYSTDLVVPRFDEDMFPLSMHISGPTPPPSNSYDIDYNEDGSITVPARGSWLADGALDPDHAAVQIHLTPFDLNGYQLEYFSLDILSPAVRNKFCVFNFAPDRYASPLFGFRAREDINYDSDFEYMYKHHQFTSLGGIDGYWAMQRSWKLNTWYNLRFKFDYEARKVSVSLDNGEWWDGGMINSYNYVRSIGFYGDGDYTIKNLRICPNPSESVPVLSTTPPVYPSFSSGFESADGFANADDLTLENLKGEHASHIELGADSSATMQLTEDKKICELAVDVLPDNAVTSLTIQDSNDVVLLKLESEFVDSAWHWRLYHETETSTLLPLTAEWTSVSLELDWERFVTKVKLNGVVVAVAAGFLNPDAFAVETAVGVSRFVLSGAAKWDEIAVYECFQMETCPETSRRRLTLVELVLPPAVQLAPASRSLQESLPPSKARSVLMHKEESTTDAAKLRFGAVKDGNAIYVAYPVMSEEAYTIDVVKVVSGKQILWTVKASFTSNLLVSDLTAIGSSIASCGLIDAGSYCVGLAQSDGASIWEKEWSFGSLYAMAASNDDGIAVGSTLSDGLAGILVFKFRGSDGEHVWHETFAPGGPGTAASAVVAQEETVVVTGTVVDTDTGVCQTYTARVDPDGVLLWAMAVVEETSVRSGGVALTATGTAVLAGSFDGSAKLFAVGYRIEDGSVLWKRDYAIDSVDAARSVGVSASTVHILGAKTWIKVDASSGEELWRPGTASLSASMASALTAVEQCSSGLDGAICRSTTGRDSRFCLPPSTGGLDALNSWRRQESAEGGCLWVQEQERVSADRAEALGEDGSTAVGSTTPTWLITGSVGSRIVSLADDESLAVVTLSNRRLDLFEYVSSDSFHRVWLALPGGNVSFVRMSAPRTLIRTGNSTLNLLGYDGSIEWSKEFDAEIVDAGLTEASLHVAFRNGTVLVTDLTGVAMGTVHAACAPLGISLRPLLSPLHGVVLCSSGKSVLYEAADGSLAAKTHCTGCSMTSHGLAVGQRADVLCGRSAAEFWVDFIPLDGSKSGQLFTVVAAQSIPGSECLGVLATSESQLFIVVGTTVKVRVVGLLFEHGAIEATASTDVMPLTGFNGIVWTGGRLALIGETERLTVAADGGSLLDVSPVRGVDEEVQKIRGVVQAGDSVFVIGTDSSRPWNVSFLSMIEGKLGTAVYFLERAEQVDTSGRPLEASMMPMGLPSLVSDLTFPIVQADGTAINRAPRFILEDGSVQLKVFDEGLHSLKTVLEDNSGWVAAAPAVMEGRVAVVGIQKRDFTSAVVCPPYPDAAIRVKLCYTSSTPIPVARWKCWSGGSSLEDCGKKNILTGTFVAATSRASDSFLLVGYRDGACRLDEYSLSSGPPVLSLELGSSCSGIRRVEASSLYSVLVMAWSSRLCILGLEDGKLMCEDNQFDPEGPLHSWEITGRALIYSNSTHVSSKGLLLDGFQLQWRIPLQDPNSYAILLNNLWVVKEQSIWQYDLDSGTLVTTHPLPHSDTLECTFSPLSLLGVGTTLVMTETVVPSLLCSGRTVLSLIHVAVRSSGLVLPAAEKEESLSSATLRLAFDSGARIQWLEAPSRILMTESHVLTASTIRRGFSSYGSLKSHFRSSQMLAWEWTGPTFSGDALNAFCVMSDDVVAIVGSTLGRLILSDEGETITYSDKPGRLDIWVGVLQNGNLLAQTILGTLLDDFAAAAAHHLYFPDSFFVLGHSEGDVITGFGGSIYDNLDAFLIRFEFVIDGGSSSVTRKWTVSTGGSGDDTAVGVAVSDLGTVYALVRTDSNSMHGVTWDAGFAAVVVAFNGVDGARLWVSFLGTGVSSLAGVGLVDSGLVVVGTNSTELFVSLVHPINGTPIERRSVEIADGFEMVEAPDLLLDRSSETCILPVARRNSSGVQQAALLNVSLADGGTVWEYIVYQGSSAESRVDVHGVDGDNVLLAMVADAHGEDSIFGVEDSTGFWLMMTDQYVAHYDVAFGTTPGGEQVLPFTGVRLEQEYTLSEHDMVPGVRYFGTVRMTDREGLSTIVASDGLVYDNSPPVGVEVNIISHVWGDETSPHTTHSGSTTAIRGRWAFLDDECRSTFARFELAIGDDSDRENFMPFVDVGTRTVVTAEDLVLAEGDSVKITVRATNAAGLQALMTSSSSTIDLTTPSGLSVWDVDESNGGVTDVEFHVHQWIEVAWSGCTAEDVPIHHYSWAIAAGSPDTIARGWMDVGLEASARDAELPLEGGVVYYGRVRCYGRNGLFMEAVTNGVSIDVNPPSGGSLGVVLDPIAKHLAVTWEGWSDLECAALGQGVEGIGSYSYGIRRADMDSNDVLPLTAVGDGTVLAINTTVPLQHLESYIVELRVTDCTGDQHAFLLSDPLQVDFSFPDEISLLDGLKEGVDVDFMPSDRLLAVQWSPVCTDEESGIVSVDIALGSATFSDAYAGWATIPANISEFVWTAVAPLSGITYISSIRCTNSLGMVSTFKSDGVRVDSTPPSVEPLAKVWLSFSVDKMTLHARWTTHETETPIASVYWTVVAGGGEIVPFSPIGTSTFASTDVTAFAEASTLFTVRVDVQNAAGMVASITGSVLHDVTPPIPPSRALIWGAAQDEACLRLDTTVLAVSAAPIVASCFLSTGGLVVASEGVVTAFDLESELLWTKGLSSIAAVEATCRHNVLAFTSSMTLHLLDGGDGATLATTTVAPAVTIGVKCSAMATAGSFVFAGGWADGEVMPGKDVYGGGTSDALVVKFDTCSAEIVTVVWSRTMGGDGADSVELLASLANGDIVGIARSESSSFESSFDRNSEFLVFRLERGEGAMLWSTRLDTGGIVDIACPASDSVVLLTADDGLTLVKVNGVTGTLLWTETLSDVGSPVKVTSLFMPHSPVLVAVTDSHAMILDEGGSVQCAQELTGAAELVWIQQLTAMLLVGQSSMVRLSRPTVPDLLWNRTVRGLSVRAAVGLVDYAVLLSGEGLLVLHVVALDGSFVVDGQPVGMDATSAEALRYNDTHAIVLAALDGGALQWVMVSDRPSPVSRFNSDALLANATRARFAINPDGGVLAALQDDMGLLKVYLWDLWGSALEAVYSAANTSSVLVQGGSGGAIVAFSAIESGNCIVRRINVWEASLDGACAALFADSSVVAVVTGGVAGIGLDLGSGRPIWRARFPSQVAMFHYAGPLEVFTSPALGRLDLVSGGLSDWGETVLPIPFPEHKMLLKTVAHDNATRLLMNALEGAAVITDNSTSVSFSWDSFVDGESRMRRYQYAIGVAAGGTEILPFQEAEERTVTVDGLALSSGVRYHVTVEGINAAGVGSSISREFLVDTFAPVANGLRLVTDFDEKHHTNSSFMTVTWEPFDEAGSGIVAYTVLLACGNVSLTAELDRWTTEHTFSGANLLPDGPCLAAVSCRDAAGLVGKGTTNTVLVDTTAPIAGIVMDGADRHLDLNFTRFTTIVSATWEGFADGTAGLHHYEWACGIEGVDDELVFPFTDVGLAQEATMENVVLLNGRNYTVLVRAVDAVGHTTTVRSSGVNVLTDDPSVTLLALTFQDLGRSLLVEWEYDDEITDHVEVHVGAGSGNDQWLPQTTVSRAESQISLEGYPFEDGLELVVVLRAVSVSGTVFSVQETSIPIDTVGPIGGEVFDGSAGADVNVQSSARELGAHWTGFDGRFSGIVRYEVAFGTVEEPEALMAFTSVALNTSLSFSAAQDLPTGVLYVASVRAFNAIGFSTVRKSDGVRVAEAPTLSVSLKGVSEVVDCCRWQASLAGVHVEWEYDDVETVGSVELSLLGGISTYVDASSTGVFFLERSLDPETDYSVLCRVTNSLGQQIEAVSDVFRVDVSAPLVSLLAFSPRHAAAAPLCNKQPPAALHLQSSTSDLGVRWAIEADQSGIADVRLSIGTSPGGDQIVSAVQVVGQDDYNVTGLHLADGAAVFATLAVMDGAGLSAAVTASISVGSALPEIGEDGVETAQDYQSSTEAVAITWDAIDVQGGVTSISAVDLHLSTAAGCSDSVTSTRLANTTLNAYTWKNLSLEPGTYFGCVAASTTSGACQVFASGGVVVDTSAPVVVVAKKIALSAGDNQRIDWRVSDEGSPITDVQWALGTAEDREAATLFQSGGLSGVSELSLPVGQWVLTVEATNAANLTAEDRGSLVVVDATAPEAGNVSVWSGTGIGLRSIEVEWAGFVEEESEIAQYAVAVGKCPFCSQIATNDSIIGTGAVLSLSVGSILHGDQIFATITATNTAGLSSTVTKLVQVWDETAPVCKVTVEGKLWQGVVYSGARLVVEALAVDPESGVVSGIVALRKDGEIVSERRFNSTSEVFAALDAGGYTVELTATNQAGLTCAVSSRPVLVVTAPPVPSGRVYDGLEGPDVDCVASADQVAAHWDVCLDDTGAPVEYFWALGSCCGCEDYLEFAQVPPGALASSAPVGLPLVAGKVVVATVRCANIARLTATACSDGARVLCQEGCGGVEDSFCVSFEVFHH